MSIEQSTKNIALTFGGLPFYATNVPAQYADKQRQYYSPETKTFTQKYAKYSSDFVEVQAQGLDMSSPLEWQTRLMRISDVVKPSAAIQRHFDDYKIVLFPDKDIEYVMPGAKIVTMGSTWIVVNPENVSGADGMGLIRRCNAVWNYLDYYGNVVSEPIVVENARANANDSDTQQSLLITKGYFNVICQYNDATRQIDTNTRFILGSGAYRVTGFSDFEQEFTGDYSTVRLLSFTVRYEEANYTIDDMENHVAGGKTFSWDISIVGPASMSAGTTVQFAAESSRNNVGLIGIGVVNTTLCAPKTWGQHSGTVKTAQDAGVTGTTLTSNEPVITYEWSSSNEAVLTVSETGYVTAVAEGEAVITATLVQNPKYSASVTVSVTATTDSVEFTSTVPRNLSYGETVTLTAAFFEGGTKTEEELSWLFDGADENAYTARASGNSAVITCYGYSDIPLTVTATYGSYAASENIELEGV